MQWFQVTVLTTTEGSEIVSNQLVEAGSGGTMIKDKRDIEANQRPEGQWDIIDENILLNMSDDVQVTGYFPSDVGFDGVLKDIRTRMSNILAMDLGVDLGPLTLIEEAIDEEDWAEYWKKDFTPIRLGKHMVVKPSWTEFEPLDGDKVIELDPGMAFGTGTHETTGLCVELLEEMLKPGDFVIDVGTGTGILAIAAALLGARQVLAIDIDPVAVRVARENVLSNGLSGNIRVEVGNLLEPVRGKADVLVMNIIADVIIAMASPVIAHIEDGGIFICSGISVNRIDDVLFALKEAGFESISPRPLGEWAAISCIKATSHA